MNSQLAMAVFVEVAQAGSFARAARKLAMSTTAVSRHVADLERMLGITLLRRSTRHLSPTEAGARYLPRAAAILEEIDHLNAEISATDTAPRGKLRITAPPAIGNSWIVPLVVDFIEAYQGIDIELEMSERRVDLVAEGFDAAIRAGTLTSSSLIAHRITEIDYVVCASPAYLERRGIPQRPEDVTDHDCINWRDVAGDPQWTFTKGDARITVPVRPRLLVSSHTGSRDAAVRGLGLVVMPFLDVRDDLEAGRLVAVLQDYETYHVTLSLVRPPTPFEPPKLRVFIDFITKALRDRALGC